MNRFGFSGEPIVWENGLYGKTTPFAGRPGASASRSADTERLVHHRDRGVQYLSIRYTERLGEVSIEPSIGSVGDSCDNALAETLIDLYNKTELIPSRTLESVEHARLIN